VGQGRLSIGREGERGKGREDRLVNECVSKLSINRQGSEARTGRIPRVVAAQVLIVGLMQELESPGCCCRLCKVQPACIRLGVVYKGRPGG
jgi:hypothetical protein